MSKYPWVLTLLLLTAQPVLMASAPKAASLLAPSDWSASQSAPANDNKQSPVTKAPLPSAKGPDSVDKSAPVQPPSGYKVGVDDELTISVWHEPEFSLSATIRPDGMITLPLLNDIKVVDLTTQELQALLTEKLKVLVNEPQVTVTVKAIHSRKVFMFGNVARQGTFALGGRMTVLELIANAGGLGPFAKSGSIYILRQDDGKQVRIPFNYKKALSGKGANPELLPGDMVVVP